MFVYCAQSWRFSTWLTTLTQPLTCPPVTAETLDLSLLRQPLVYIRLHGMPGQPYLYGDDWQTALSLDQLQSVSLPGSLVFLEGCYGALLSSAFIAAGASAVIGSTQATVGKRYFLGVSSKIGRAWLAAIQRGDTAETALIKSGADNSWNVFGDPKARL